MKFFLYRFIPKRLLSDVFFYLSRIETRPWKDILIALFCRVTGADTSFAATKDRRAYASLNDFFTRSLAEDARPFPKDDNAIISPVDGRCGAFGVIDRGTLLQAKGQNYALAELLDDSEQAKFFEQGSYLTLYLAPDDYHRVHMPCAGRLLGMRYCKGLRHSVAPWILARVANVFCGNERLVCVFETDHGRMALVMVGALNVGSMATVWQGTVRAASSFSVEHEDIHLAQGAEMGRFNLGSTVILLFEKGAVHLQEARLRALGKIKMGEVIAYGR